MIEPIRFSTYQSTSWPDMKVDGLEQGHPSKDDFKPAEAEIASLYYQSSIQSLKPPIDPLAASKQAVKAAQEQKKEKSTLQKVTDWFWNLIGWGKKEEAIENLAAEEDASAPNAPILQSPEAIDQQKLSHAIAELNRELVNRLKDLAEFEEEMRRSTSKQLDKLIFKTLIFSSLDQKKIKERLGTLDQEDILKLHQRNKELQKTYYSLADEITSRAKTNKILHWVSIGNSVGIVGLLALSIATAGSALPVALGLASITKGGLTLANGILKYKNDLATGELFIVSQETKKNSAGINDKINELQTTTEEIASLLKTIRHHLDNQSRAERVFGRM
jgi:hypothetical protein